MNDYYAPIIVEAYDEVVTSHGAEQVQLTDVLDETVQAVKKKMMSGEIEMLEASLDDSIRRLVSPEVEKTRKHRRASFKKNVLYLLDALRAPDDAANLEPLFRMAMPLGNGFDKVLGYWVPQDFERATMVRYRNAADVTREAQEFDMAADLLVQEMHRRRVSTVRELFQGVAA